MSITNCFINTAETERYVAAGGAAEHKRRFRNVQIVGWVMWAGAWQRAGRVSRGGLGRGPRIPADRGARVMKLDSSR